MTRLNPQWLVELAPHFFAERNMGARSLYTRTEGGGGTSRPRVTAEDDEDAPVVVESAWARYKKTGEVVAADTGGPKAKRSRYV